MFRRRTLWTNTGTVLTGLSRRSSTRRCQQQRKPQRKPRPRLLRPAQHKLPHKPQHKLPHKQPHKPQHKLPHKQQPQQPHKPQHRPPRKPQHEQQHRLLRPEQHKLSCSLLLFPMFSFGSDSTTWNANSAQYAAQRQTGTAHMISPLPHISVRCSNGLTT